MGCSESPKEGVDSHVPGAAKGSIAEDLLLLQMLQESQVEMDLGTGITELP